MRRLSCPYLFHIFPSFGASGDLCFVIVALPGYLHLYFFIYISAPFAIPSAYFWHILR